MVLAEGPAAIALLSGWEKRMNSDINKGYKTILDTGSGGPRIVHYFNPVLEALRVHAAEPPHLTRSLPGSAARGRSSR